MSAAGVLETGAVRARLAALGASGDLTDLGEAALLLAALDRPRVGLDRYRAHLAETAALLADLGPLDAPEERAAALEEVLRHALGYQGDSQSYDDLQNANLMRVIDRRRGLPVALAILYLQAARSQGWPAAALRFPGHVLIRLEGAAGRLVLDPFNGGGPLGAARLRALAKALGGPAAELTPAHSEAMSDREVLLRLQNNIKQRRLGAGDSAGGLAALESMLLLAPAEPGLWAEAAALHARLENLTAAAAALARVAHLAESPQQRAEAERQRRLLLARLN